MPGQGVARKNPLNRGIPDPAFGCGEAIYRQPQHGMVERQKPECRVEDRMADEAQTPQPGMVNAGDDDLASAEFQKLWHRAFAIRRDQALGYENDSGVRRLSGARDRIVVAHRSPPGLEDFQSNERLAIDRRRAAPGEVSLVVSEDGDRRRIPGRAHQCRKMKSRRRIPPVSGRDIRSIERRDQAGQPALRKSCIGVAEDIDVGIVASRYRESQVVNLLAAVGSPAGHQDVHPEPFERRVSRIILRVDDELNGVVGIILIKDRLDVFLEFRVSSLARAKHDHPVVTGCAGLADTSACVWPHESRRGV